MLHYDRIDICEGFDVNNTTASKECDICHHWYFINYSFKVQPNVFNRCHDLLMIIINLSEIATLNIKGYDYHCIISLISKNRTIKLLQNADLAEKIGAFLKKSKIIVKKYKEFLNTYISYKKL